MIDPTPDHRIERHRTAIMRQSPSQPVAALIGHGLLGPGMSMFDYGCGRGDDVRHLIAKDVAASGWDPFYAPDAPRVPADVVNLGFVVNVIEAPSERSEVLRAAWGLAGKVLAVSAMLTGQGVAHGRLAHSDGVLSARNTFQKYFDQSELADLIASATGTRPVAASPGVFFVFRERDDEEAFLINRSARGRSHSIARGRSPIDHSVIAARMAPVLDEVARFALLRGRMPQADELSVLALGTLAAERIPLSRALARYMDPWLDPNAIEAAGRRRASDLVVHFAMGILNGRDSTTSLGLSITRDISALFGGKRALVEKARRQLLALADMDEMSRLCTLAAEAKLGIIDEHGRFLAAGCRVANLPTALRCYFGCAIHLAGEPDGDFVFRLDARGKRVKLLPLDDDGPFPAITSSIIVDLKRQKISIKREARRLLRKCDLHRITSSKLVRLEEERRTALGLPLSTIFEELGPFQDFAGRPRGRFPRGSDGR